MEDEKTRDKIWQVVVILIVFSLGVTGGWLVNEYLAPGMAKMITWPFVIGAGGFIGMVILAMIDIVIKRSR